MKRTDNAKKQAMLDALKPRCKHCPLREDLKYKCDTTECLKILSKDISSNG